MVYAKPLSRIPWEDQFNTPSLTDLRSHYTRQLGQLVETARARVQAFAGVAEDLQWMGLPWRWTLVYQVQGCEGHALAYLIPHREKPILALPLSDEQIATLPMSRLRKFIREGLEHGRRVGDTRWVAYEVTNKTHLELVIDLVKRKHKALTNAR
ncbi:MAG: hypothetical protein D6692_00130 [Planctomycetota bacterium]|nr:MAG: hypothetical protein D6692_00130 [Planctomycetota bacterium]